MSKQKIAKIHHRRVFENIFFFMKGFDKRKWSGWDGFTILWSRMVKRELVCFCYFLLIIFLLLFFISYNCYCL